MHIVTAPKQVCHRSGSRILLLANCRSLCNCTKAASRFSVVHSADEHGQSQLYGFVEIPRVETGQARYPAQSVGEGVAVNCQSLSAAGWHAALFEEGLQRL